MQQFKEEEKSLTDQRGWFLATSHTPSVPIQQKGSISPMAPLGLGPAPLPRAARMGCGGPGPPPDTCWGLISSCHNAGSTGAFRWPNNAMGRAATSMGLPKHNPSRAQATTTFLNSN